MERELEFHGGEVGHASASSCSSLEKLNSLKSTRDLTSL